MTNGVTETYMQDENKLEKILSGITESNSSPDEKIAELNNLIAGLNPLDHGSEIRRASEIGGTIAAKADRPEMAAQFCLMRAKAEIAEVAPVIAEMKNLQMAIDWFEFALETEEERYKELNHKLQTAWQSTQTIIDVGYKLLNKKPYVGAVAYCHRTAGEIYASYYLQLKLYYFTAGKPWKARVGNIALVRWLDLDDLFIMTKKSRVHLRSVKRDCLNALHQAVRLFKREKAHTYLIESYFELALEHHSFNNPIRSKIYLWWGWLLIKWYKIDEPRLQKSFISLRELPLIGSSRDKNLFTGYQAQE
jgi:hypothetical protein